MGGVDGRLYLIDRTNDALEPLDVPIGIGTVATASTATITGEGGAQVNTVFVAGDDGFFYAYDLAEGRQAWKHPIDSCCTAAVDSSRLFIGGKDGRLHVLSAGGAPLGEWPHESDPPLTPITTDVTLADGKAFFASGTDLWWVDVNAMAGGQCDLSSGGVFVTPVVSEGMVYAANGDGSIYLLDAATCQEGDRVNVGDALTVKPAVHHGIIYQPGLRGVTAFDPSSDEPLLWGPKPIGETGVLAPGVKTSPAVAGGLVYFGARDGFVYALHIEDGSTAWRWYTGAPISASVAVTDGVVYVATEDGQVIAIGGEEGTSQPVPTTGTPGGEEVDIGSSPAS